jgi:hypothetical protein
MRGRGEQKHFVHFAASSQANLPTPSETTGSSEDWRLQLEFPFMSPNLLWKVMAIAGFFVYAACTLSPPNPFTGGSQLNAALTLFQAILLWKAPASFGHEARRSLSLTCAIGYAASAGVTLSDVFFTRTTARLVLWLGSFLTFYLGAQANMVYLILDSQAKGTGKPGILSETFQFNKGQKKKNNKNKYDAFMAVLKAFSRIFLMTLVTFGASMLGKYSRELVGLAFFSAST